MEERVYKWDVGFSFVSEDEQLVAKINEMIRPRLTTFFSPERQRDITAKDGLKVFKNVFAKESRVVVVLYRGKRGHTDWTRIEEAAIEERVLKEGWDFLLVLCVEKNATPPEWLPAMRLWFDAQVFDIEQAIERIETLVQEAGGSAREELPSEHAARLKREEDAKMDRRKFLDSEEGVNKALEETMAVVFAVEEMAPGVASNSELKLTPNRPDPQQGRIGLEICAQYACMLIDWCAPYKNTLDDSYLSVQLWNGPFNGRKPGYLKNPNPVREERYSFDVDTNGVVGWRTANEKGLLQSRAVAEMCLKILLDQAFKRRRGKAG